MSSGPPSERRALRGASVLVAVVAFALGVVAFAASLSAVLGTGDDVPALDESARRPNATAGGTAPAAAKVRPAANQAFLTGTITRLTGDGVDGPRLAMPLTLMVAVRGDTGVEMTGGTVGGTSAAVIWDGGRPLPMSGPGALDLAGPTHLVLTPTGPIWSVDGHDRQLTAGSYALGATVAVGSTGLALPRDGVTLVVPAGMVAAVHPRGAVTVSVAPAPLALRGPGMLLIEGALAVETTTGTKNVGSVSFGPGPFELDLTPTTGGYTVTHGILQGRFELGG